MWEILLLVLAPLTVLVGWALWIYATFRGDRLITCPENHQPAAVKVDARAAATRLARGRLQLKSCSRWPEKAGCAQDCVSQIEADPRATLVETQMAQWYRGKACRLCGKEVSFDQWALHKPALLAPDGQTIEWITSRPELLPALLETHKPICWDCHVAETFRRQYPDLHIDWPTPEDRDKTTYQ